MSELTRAEIEEAVQAIDEVTSGRWSMILDALKEKALHVEEAEHEKFVAESNRDYWKEQSDEAERQNQVLREALRRLAFAAQTSGGTAGRDDELVAAIGQAEQAFAYPSESDGGERCPTCGAQGFEPSVIGPERCTFCDGTEGGHPPEPSGDASEALDTLIAEARKDIPGFPGHVSDAAKAETTIRHHLSRSEGVPERLRHLPDCIRAKAPVDWDRHCAGIRRGYLEVADLVETALAAHDSGQASVPDSSDEPWAPHQAPPKGSAWRPE